MKAEPDPGTKGRRWSTKILKILLVLIGASLVLGWLLATPSGLLGKSDAIAYAVCHRIGSHSFQIGGRPFSLCARCTGQYLGFFWGFSLQALLGRRKSGFPGGWGIALLAGLILAYVGDGLNSFFHLYPGLESWSVYQPNNILRLYTGLGMGLAISGFYYPLMGQTIWREFSPAEPLDRAWRWGMFLGGGALLGLLVLWENPLVSYYLILVSTAGLLTLLTLLYMVIWILIFRKENTVQDLKALRWWIAAGFSTAVVQIALMDAVRFTLTGSWSGFLDY